MFLEWTHGARAPGVWCQSQQASSIRAAIAMATRDGDVPTAKPKRARMAGVRFEIEEHHIVIPRICPVLGLPLTFGRGRRGPCDASPTLDRIVPARGYVSGNIIVISWRANRLKSDATVDELARIVDWFRTIVGTTG